MIWEWVVLVQRLHIVFHNVESRNHIEERWARKGLRYIAEGVNGCRIETERIYITESIGRR
jgi:hypothetical protein